MKWGRWYEIIFNTAHRYNMLSQLSGGEIDSNLGQIWGKFESDLEQIEVHGMHGIHEKRRQHEYASPLNHFY